MAWLIFPEWTLGTIVFYILLALFCISIGILDKLGLSKVRYSKFRTGKGLPSRVGMFILYFVPFIAHSVLALPYTLNGAPMQWLLFLAIALHFAKRCLEVLFLHKYAGPIDTMTVTQITSFYTTIAVGTALLHTQTLPVIDGLFIIGVVFYVVGEYFNYVHHKILADLRKQTDTYHIPRGGLFSYVACPHYLAEIVAWLGITLMSRHVFTVLIFIGTCSNLIARSLKTRAWYREKFPNYPEERRALIPFVL